MISVVTIKKLALTLTFPFFMPSAQAEDMKSVTLSNGNMQMTVINYGARIQRLKFAGQDIVLGFDTLEHYAAIKQNFGACVGRYIGRIIGGRLPIAPFQLQVGANGDCAHGGTPSFSQRYWQFVSNSDSTIVLRYISPDGENGFPGELTLDITYTLLHDALRIDYEATTTKPTVLNPSNHSFFNLSADLGSSVLDELLWINSDSICLYNDKKQVTGQMMSVTDTPFDFRKVTPIGERINADHPQLQVTGGYDHCYALPLGENWEGVPVAR